MTSPRRPRGPRAPRGRPATIDREQIAAAALRLCQRDGLDAVTMRSVAAALDVTSNALYRHLGSAAELADLVVEGMLAAFDMPPPPPPGDEPRWLVELAHARYTVLLEHPGVAGYLLTRGPTGHAGFDYMEQVATVLRAAGVPPTQLWHAYVLFVGTICNHAAQRTAIGRRLDAHPEQGTTATVAPPFATDRPTLTAMLPHMRHDPATSFDFAITTVLRGLLGNHPDLQRGPR